MSAPVLFLIVAGILELGAVAFAGIAAVRAERTAAEVSLRITQLAAGPVPHPYRCPHCRAPFTFRAHSRAEGERGFCGACRVWHQIASAGPVQPERGW